MDELLRDAIYLTGPTASGKTAVGVALARAIGAEVVAMDSMTLYRGMDIGTAKPSIAERGGIPHHLIDVLDPWEAASVADYRRWAIEAVTEIESRGRRVLFVGGTPLYLKALLRGLFEGPSADLGRRIELEKEAEIEGDLAFHARLAAIDPKTAGRLHPNDRRRIIRALEVFEATGSPLSEHQSGHARPAEGVAVFALERPREEIQARINARVVAMFEAGFVEEVRALISGLKPLHPVPAQGVGYREVIALIRGESTPSETIALIQARTRQFSKRQGTWFRGLEEVRAFPVAKEESAEAIAERLADAVDRDHDSRKRSAASYDDTPWTSEEMDALAEESRRLLDG